MHSAAHGRDGKGTDMRKLAMLAVLASTALASPALARDNAWYVGVEGGAIMIEDIKTDIGALQDPLTTDPEFGACTIWPLPMYMPTWLIGE